MTDRRFFLESPTGTRIELITGQGGPYSLMVGTMGLGVPPVRNRFSQGADDGETFRGKAYGMRAMDLPIFVEGANRAEMEARVRALADVVDVPATEGMPKIIVEYASGEVYEMNFVYSSGLEGDGPKSTAQRTEVPLSVLCPLPFWVARDALQFTLQADPSPVGLLPDLAALPIASSETFGELTVNNPGDVECPITWVITGPGGPAGAELAGRGWEFEATLAEGEIVTVERTQTGVTVKDNTAANRYSDMADAPFFSKLPKGASVLNVSMVDATTASSVVGYFRPRKKVVY